MFECKLNQRNILLWILAGLFLIVMVTVYFYGTALYSVKPAPLYHLTEYKCTEAIAKSESEWFQAKHNSKIKPFWTKDNFDIEAGASKWWNNLQSRKTKKNLTSMLQDLFNRGVPKYQRDITPQRKGNCILCAVVGNSANLKDSNYGEAIDKSDVVIRVNKARTLGFEKDVGSKTTYHIVYPESAIDLSPDTSLTLVPFKPMDVEWLLSALTTGTITKMNTRVPKTIKCNVSKIAIFHPEFIKHVHTTWMENTGRYPSTGAIGVGFALQICDKVNIYGFGADKDGGWQHYWEKLTDKTASDFRKTDNHSVDKQEKLLEKLASEGVANLYRGNWNKTMSTDDKTSQH